jgi:hypothetical protein
MNQEFRKTKKLQGEMIKRVLMRLELGTRASQCLGPQHPISKRINRLSGKERTYQHFIERLQREAGAKKSTPTDVVSQTWETIRNAAVPLLGVATTLYTVCRFNPQHSAVKFICGATKAGVTEGVGQALESITGVNAKQLTEKANTLKEAVVKLTQPEIRQKLGIFCPNFIGENYETFGEKYKEKLKAINDSKDDDETKRGKSLLLDLDTSMHIIKELAQCLGNPNVKPQQEMDLNKGLISCIDALQRSPQHITPFLQLLFKDPQPAQVLEYIGLDKNRALSVIRVLMGRFPKVQKLITTTITQEFQQQQAQVQNRMIFS